MNRKWMLGAIAGVLAVSTAGCGGQNQPAASDGGGEDSISGTITYLTNRTDLIGNVYDDYAKRFNEKYPDAHVEFEATIDYDKTAKMRLSSGDFPDVMNIPTIANTELPNYYAPLDDLGLTDSIRFPDYKSDGGVLYGMPSGVDVVGVVYNKQAFEKAGIDKVPTTLDEFYAASEKLKAAGIVPLASNFKDQWPVYPFAAETPVAMSGNVDLSNERVNTDAPYTLDGPYGQSMNILRTMHEKGYLEADINSTNWEQSKKDVASGKFAMFYLGEWIIPQLIGGGMASEDIGFFPFPYDNEAGSRNVVLSPASGAYGVNKNSEHLATAKAFVKWMIEESGADADMLPILKDGKAQIAQMEEFDSYKPTYLEGKVDTAEALAIVNKAQIVKEAIVQEFVLADNPQETFDKYNKMWAKAKAEVAK